MTVLRYRLATCSYSQFKTEMGVPVRSSLGGPRWWKGGIPPNQVMLEIAPHGSYLRAPKDVYEGRYLHQLDRFGVETLIERFNEVGDSVGVEIGSTLVLLCFEKLTPESDTWCHRTMFREWWARQTGEVIPELTSVSPAPDEEQWTLDL